MTVERETYNELLHAMIFAYAGNQLTLPQIGSVMWACAQPDTTEGTTDVTHGVRAALTDWSEMDKGMLICVESVQLTFKCVNLHGPCNKKQHSVMMTRVIGSMDWEPEAVSSSHVFSEVILQETLKLNPQHEGGRVVSNSRHRHPGSYADLIGTFRDMFMEPPEQAIDKEIDQFRAELDALFPSAPTNPHQKGGSDDSQRPTT